MTEDAVAKEIVDVAFHMHTVLGPGLFESVYEAILASELQKRGLRLVRQQLIPVVYEGTRFEMGFRADIVVEDQVIIEVKSIAEIAPLHKKQLLNYLRLSDKRLGLLINFNVGLIKDGITRVVNRLDSQGQKMSRKDAKAQSKEAKKQEGRVPGRVRLEPHVLSSLPLCAF